MAKKAYVRRYSEAIFQIAREKDQLDRWQADLQRIAGMVTDAAMLAWFENTKVRFEAKDRTLTELLREVNPLALNLARLLVAKGRLDEIGHIAEHYQELVHAHRGIVEAEVITAVPLEEPETERLAEKLGAIVGKEIVVKPRVDPAVLGGVIARFGGKLLDGSTRTKLEALRHDIASTGGKG